MNEMTELGGRFSSAKAADYDRQFEEDLERARALSLESLALEKFRQQKELEKFRVKTQSVPITETELTVPTADGMPVQQMECTEIKSRPRPGSFNTGRPRVPRLPPPPPAVQRRNSTTNSSVDDRSDSQDLISFSSPSPPDRSSCGLDLESLVSDTDRPTFERSQSVVPQMRLSSSSSVSSPFVPSIPHGYPKSGSKADTIHSYHPLQHSPQQQSHLQPRSGFLGFSYRTALSEDSPVYNTVIPVVNKSDFSVQQVFDPVRTFSQAVPGVHKGVSGTGDSSNFNVLKVIEKKDNSNLIDLQSYDSKEEESVDKTLVRVSVLEAFDPLLSDVHVKYNEFNRTSETDMSGADSKNAVDDTESQCSGSYYDAYDPFDYMHAPSCDGSQSDPVYAAVVKEKAPATVTTPPPLPPRSSAAWSTIERRRSSLERRTKTKSRLYENVRVRKCSTVHQNSELLAFHNMVKKLRSEFPCDDPYTNVGLVISPTLESTYAERTSIKLVVHSKKDENPVTFTCDVNSTVEHVIYHVVCELEGDLTGDVKDYVLKVWGLAEYFTSQTSLSDYEYVHQCIKLEQDVVLTILHIDQLTRPLARTLQDDKRDTILTLEELVPNEPSHPITHDNLLIILQTLEQEMERVHHAALQMAEKNNPSVMPSLQSKGVVQAVKAVCTYLGNIETQEITEALEGFKSACLQFIPVTQTEVERSRSGIAVKHPEILDDDGDYSIVTLRMQSASDHVENVAENITHHCDNIRDAIQVMVETYCHAFHVDFQLSTKAELPSNTKHSSEILDSVLVHVGGLHRLNQDWNYDQYLVAAQIYHGTRPLGQPVLTHPIVRSMGLFERVLFDFWLNFEGISICMLPLESRIVLVVYGQTVLPPENPDAKDASQEPRLQKIELGWAALQFFDCDRVMVQGSFLLSLWPAVADKRLGPAPAAGTRPHADTEPVLWIDVPEFGARILFPRLEPHKMSVPKGDFGSLDPNTQELLNMIAEQDTFTRTPVEEREVLWEKRHYLYSKPKALPKVLLAAHSWDWACLADLHAMIHNWAKMDPLSALQLLLPCFPDTEVRRVAVTWVEDMGSDELVDLLPQLVQALKHETWEASPLAHFLLKRALISPRVAHHLYWLLTQTLPGESPQNTSEAIHYDERTLSEARYYRRLQLMLRALIAISGSALRQRFFSQQLLVKNMYETAEKVKSTKESLRLKVLIQELEVLHHSLNENPTCLPLSPSLEVGGIQVRTCSYFPSNTLPLKINFLSTESGIIPAIFKVGDDLQQDMLTIQMVRIMNKLWLKEGLDLKMVTFSCVPTGHKRGMIEMVTNAETLRKIQVELGLTGSFKDRPIAEWLAKHNPSAFEYERAVANFTASCAGYSVATYILGICDRHNDNIMLKTSGHLFHIDFGKFLGDAQMFGNFKRDRTPFVLTSDMAYVINGGDKPTAKFHHFVDLCCQAFNIVRKHGNLILDLFGLMVSSGIPGVTKEAVEYVQRALLPNLSNPEAAATFARMIESSLKSWFTQFNFFLHNLAQLRFTGDHNDGELLSFIPRTYTMQQEGRIKSVHVYGYQKRYDPEKYYVYILRVERINQPDPTFLFRSYKEFCELHQKLCILFPLAKCYSLPTGLSMGRSNIKQVAEKRRVDIERFLKSLFEMADEISHSDLVYTFFHPLLRDQQEADIRARKVKAEPRVRREDRGETGRVRGQLKLSLHYQRGVFMVMVYHARDLPLVAGGQEPSTYVKVYLLPDHNKATKRKTKVVRRTCHPSFMEMLEYRMQLDIVKSRKLQATIWNHDTLQENEFLGGFTLPLNAIDLSQETIEWYTLTNISR
ncbi:phosphatidylinositol 4-phosphate 3-kinase C2 domain-containing subunit alpha isoform X1 [Schistocerca serialis cubense]|uniref:phosphatidylinositol 4-phosphate 3-kinase C2 domain-containing subunit alpha isoform X1 n=2 Tax=Schistocerca serialis cubense TaxID=2023355 RepID=UPI00214F0497|nr:phosphatidylinositol 4-phosphate 3-kinase C2 domain-containing subunit alpha isoform X1 [Schistocerca serialis cubense]